MYHIKSDKRSVRSSEWFFEALEALMLETEYSKIKVIDLADKAKLGRTTFYRNFDTIDDILRMKCDEKLLGLKNYFMEYYKEAVLDTQGLFLKPFLNYWYVDSNIVELIIKADKIDVFQVSFTNMVNEYRDLITTRNSDTTTNRVSLKNANYINKIRVAVSISILTEWIKNDKDVSPDELSEILISRLKNPINLDIFS